MNEFIGNHIHFIAHWGQWITAIIVLFSIALIFRIVRKNKFYLPNGFLSAFFSFLLLLLIVLSSLVFLRITKNKPGVMVILNQLDDLKGKETPPLTFHLMSDTAIHSIEEYRGQVVLLNYWATWCAPCLKEMPDLNALHEKYNNSGLSVIALSDESGERLLSFSQKRPFKALASYTKSFDWVDMGSERPVTFLINKEGIIEEYFTGPYDYKFFEQQILKYL